MRKKTLFLLLLTCFSSKAGSLGLLTSEEFNACYAAAVVCNHEDIGYVQENKISDSDALKFLATPRTAIKEENISLANRAQELIKQESEELGFIMVPWENMSSVLLGSLINPFHDKPLDIASLFALAFVRGIEPFQALYHRLVDDEALSVKVEKLKV